MTESVSQAPLMILQRAAGNAAVERMLSAPGGTGSIQRLVTPHDESATISVYRGIRDIDIRRPQQVNGDVIHTDTSKRPAAPEPQAVVTLASGFTTRAKTLPKVRGKRKPTATAKTVWQDLFGNGAYDRGHLLGLEVGGMDGDVAGNIVPQWALNQQSGEWRNVEHAMDAFGLQNPGSTVTIRPTYQTSYGNFRAVMVPRSIQVVLAGPHPNSTPHSFNWTNHPNVNDLSRAAIGPEDSEDMYWSQQARHTGATNLSDKNMDNFVFEAMRHNDGHLAALNKYRGDLAQLDADIIAETAKYTKSNISYKSRKKKLDEWVREGLVIDNKDDTYQLNTAPPPILAALVPATSEAKPSTAAAPNQTLLEVDFPSESESGDDDYMISDGESDGWSDSDSEFAMDIDGD